MPFYAELQAATQQEQGALHAIPLIQDALEGRVTRAQYIAFLTQAYHHVKHTVPLMMACGAHLNAAQAWLLPALADYIGEEIGHEEWILDDIRACGGNAERVRDGTPKPATELMVAYAYDLVGRVNPVGLLGMIYVLEGTSIQLATRAADSLRNGLYLPPQAFSYLSSHGALDQEHMRFFGQLVDRLTASADRECVIRSAKMFFRLYGDMFRTLEETPA